MIVDLPHRPSAALRRLIASRHDDGGEPLQQSWVGDGAMTRAGRLSVTRADGAELSATEQAHVRAAIAALVEALRRARARSAPPPISRMDEIDRVDLLRIAAGAVLDPRTVRRYLAGRRVGDATRGRIRRAMRDLGIRLSVTRADGAELSATEQAPRRARARLDARRLGLLLAAAADTSPRLARRWLAGEPVRHREAARLAAAADALGVRPDELGRETSPAEEP